MSYRHGEAQRGKQTPEHLAWSSMMCRCYTTTSSPYPFYGGRGITVCERWHTFENFLSDMGRKPRPGMSVDRKDSDGNYEPGNCRWATQKEQCRNRRSTRWIEIDGETMSMAAWGERTGIDPDLIWYRLSAGWDNKRAVFSPPRTRR